MKERLVFMQASPIVDKEPLKIYSREDSLKINVEELYVLTNILKTCIIYLQGK